MKKVVGLAVALAVAVAGCSGKDERCQEIRSQMLFHDLDTQIAERKADRLLMDQANGVITAAQRAESLKVAPAPVANDSAWYQKNCGA